MEKWGGGKLCIFLSKVGILVIHFLFLQRVGIACYADGCISYGRVCPSVLRHTLVLCREE